MSSRPAGLVVALSIIVLVGAGCVRSEGAPEASPSASSSPAATVAPSPLSLAQLKYGIVDELGRPQFCDPDEYPVARADEETLAQERFPEIQAETETFRAIVAHLGLAGTATFAPERQLAIYREYKMLRALTLEPIGPRYRFQLRVASTQDPEGGSLVTGSIERDGRITVTGREDAGSLICPVCLAGQTLIDTPAGPIAVEDLRPGMAVWTADAGGIRHAGVALEIGSAPVPPGHQVVHLVLEDGRELWASPGHPLADGRRLGQLSAGDLVDGVRVASVALETYGGFATFDLLPSGPTGAYWANGVPIRSTLGR